ncbi:hypothetical protein Tcan_04438 [Toxocara canis]|uniref:MADF domain-containing protein n=2 Tax=Toxocara canis TaxID=6265 RepID=A0A0B2VCY1_TOXCA|nr:hypothetical protein Tcan_04438 [Toxocara canis]VDM46877.1 unnamed protein product [Toxocara canis]
MSEKVPLEKRRKMALEDVLKATTGIAPEDIFEDNGSDEKVEQKEDNALTFNTEKKRRTRLPRRIRDELFELVLQKEHELFIDDVTQSGNLRKRMAWNEILLSIITNHPELPLTLGMIRRTWRGVVAKIRANRSRFQAYCSNTNESSEIMKDCPFSKGELNVFRWLSKRPGFCCYQNNGLEEVDGGNSAIAQDYAGVSESDREYESEERENDVIESGRTKRKRKLGEIPSVRNDMTSIRTEIPCTRGEVSFVRNEVPSLRGEISSASSDMYSAQMVLMEASSIIERMSFMRETRTLLQAMHSVMMRHMQISEQIDEKLAVLIANQGNRLNSNQQALDSPQYGAAQGHLGGFTVHVVQPRNSTNNSSSPSGFSSAKVKTEE